ncbi:unnamed protein product [Zymoseptoria tritici ST99CH_3D1]|uniref:Uncharacterized protein n=1 Tax=Zymoseptoria tritici ST99CH_1E4 TaxID=1276532 RepID=A0A2H1GUB0_ZYMTR|nr:unnamed protein product [Zymoseptoria tritici ST99CH_1E4]SMR60018.1 unnamed protein product [Zymoseptoria tritici ST99CH_3D1]
MAAAKFFALPELLENVLIKLAYMANIEEDDKPMRDDPALQPLTTLAPCHRVSREFDSTLKGSRRLQRLMYDGSPAYNNSRFASLRPARWLALTLGGSMSTGLTALPYGFFLQRTGKATGDKCSKGHDNPEASWRHVKFISKESHELEYILGGMSIVWEADTQGFDTLNSKDVLLVHADVTLGDFETWLHASAWSDRMKEYDIDDVRVQAFHQDAAKNHRTYNRGTLDDPQVLLSSLA